MITTATPAMKRACKRVLQSGKYDFSKGFSAWLHQNWHVYAAFHSLAAETANKRDHYSAYTIREVLRWHTAVREWDSEFKLSNNHTPDLARLFNGVTGREFFRLHERFVRGAR